MENSIKLSTVIISAGYSSRMGDFKPLLKFGEKTALEVLVETYIQCGIEDIVVVLGYRAEDIIEKLRHLKVKWTINEDYKDGMYSSIKVGIMKIDKDSIGFFLNPVDIPIIKTSTIESLKLEYSKGEKDIIYPVFNGRRGHPPLISSIYIKHILEDSSSSHGLKGLLSLYEKSSSEVSVIDFGIVKDMDTPADYKELKEYFKLRYVPTVDECSAIWNRYELPLNIIEHCKAVADVACDISNTLLEKECNIDLNKIKAAALLHDIGRLEKKHEEAGAKILRNLGYDEIADIIKVHMNISSDIQNNSYITEKEIVYLADKLVLDKNIVPLEERFKKSLDKYENNPEVLKKIRLRFKNCEIIIDKIKRITGENL